MNLIFASKIESYKLFNMKAINTFKKIQLHNNKFIMILKLFDLTKMFVHNKNTH